MFKKGEQFSQSHIENLSKSHLNQIPWNKGKKGVYSESTISKMKQNRTGKGIGHIVSVETRDKIRLKRKGLKLGPMSEVHKNKISAALKGKPNPHPNRRSLKGIPTGIIPPCAFKKGHKTWNRIDGRSSRIDLKNRYGKEWPIIRSKVFERDGHCCQACKSDGVSLEVHHIIPFLTSKDNGYDNLISLCKKCHRKIEAKEMRILKGKEVA